MSYIRSLPDTPCTYPVLPYLQSAIYNNTLQCITLHLHSSILYVLTCIMLHNPALHYVTLCPTLPCTSLHYYITVIGDPFPKIGGSAGSAMSSCRACSNASTEKTEGVACRQNRRQHHSGIASCEILYLLVSPNP